jgi:hypothetical protein
MAKNETSRANLEINKINYDAITYYSIPKQKKN